MDLRREHIKSQAGLVNALMHTEGYAAAATKAALAQMHSLIERAERLGEPLEDPLLPLYVLYGFWLANFVAFDGKELRKLAAQIKALAANTGVTTIVPSIISHRTEDTKPYRDEHDDDLLRRMLACVDKGEHLRAFVGNN
jgi:hypothetical protein